MDGPRIVHRVVVEAVEAELHASPEDQQPGTGKAGHPHGGKPILDRSITEKADLYDALKLGLISMDSTMRSNLSVGMPIDLLLIRRDAMATEIIYRIDAAEPYFHDLRERWSAALRAAHLAIPPPPYAVSRK